VLYLTLGILSLSEPWAKECRLVNVAKLRSSKAHKLVRFHQVGIAGNRRIAAAPPSELTASGSSSINVAERFGAPSF
jgi:hypothetical protein